MISSDIIIIAPFPIKDTFVYLDVFMTIFPHVIYLLFIHKRPRLAQHVLSKRREFRRQEISLRTAYIDCGIAFWHFLGKRLPYNLYGFFLHKLGVPRNHEIQPAGFRTPCGVSRPYTDFWILEHEPFIRFHPARVCQGELKRIIVQFGGILQMETDQEIVIRIGFSCQGLLAEHRQVSGLDFPILLTFDPAFNKVEPFPLQG